MEKGIKLYKSKYLFRIFNIVLLFFFSVELSSQCIEEQTTSNGGTGSSNGQSFGQQFIPCETGDINEVELLVTTGNGLMRLEVYESATNWNNLIWTVDNISINSSGTFIIDLDLGNGITQNLNSGQTYSLRFWNISPSNFALGTVFSSTDSYTNGARLNHSGSVINCSPNFCDTYFRISINNAPLPVELINFSGQILERKVELNWSTASELDNLGFEIQKSINGRDWRTINFAEGQGTSNEINEYRYDDLNPYSGFNYYRLKQIDFDGAFEYSKVIAVEYDNSKKSIRVFPNPSNGLINLQIDNPSSQRMKITISDNLGRKVWESVLVEGESNWRKEIEIEENGIYFVTAQIGDEIFYERVIITDEK